VNKNRLSLLYLNAQHLRAKGKFESLKTKIRQTGLPDIISVTETWLLDDEERSLKNYEIQSFLYIQLSNYNLF